ncbi:MAG: metal-dependent hydrolase, partial [Sphingomonadales bacterium]
MPANSKRPAVAGEAAKRGGVFALGVALMALGLAGCTHLPRARLPACSLAPAPAIKVAADGGSATTTLDVLTYNIEGLPWPARASRAKQLAEIGRILSELQGVGQAPDIVLFQEMFSGAAVRAVDQSGYAALVAGPGRTQKGPEATGRLPLRAKPLKGEIGIRLMTSGLAIASRFPIVTSHSEPYARLSCAGFDCLANKGVLAARVVIPGVPSPVDLLNTH